MPTTPNMSMVLPTEGGDDDVWDTIINAALTLNDAHDHTTGKGVKIPSAALRINADVPWNDAGVYYAVTGAKAVDFQPSAAVDVATYAGALFVNAADNELYYRTTSGSNVKFTNGTTLNVAAFAGGIGGDYAASGALVSYVDADDAYYFQQQGSPRPWARIRTGDVDIYQTAASIVNRIRLMSPAVLAASYALTFAGALPGAQAMVQTTATGQLVYSNALAVNQSVTVSGTGEFKHADRKMSQSALVAFASSGTVSFSSASNAMYSQVSSGGIAYFPIYGLRQGMRLKAVAVAASSSNEPTIAVRLQVRDVAATLTTTTAGTIVANSYKTLTLTTPNTMSDDDFIYVVVTSTGTTCNVSTIEAIYDIP